MSTPGARSDLVFDQLVNGHIVRHTQQRLSQTHQCNAFLGREAVLRQEFFHNGGLGILADAAYQIGGALRDSIALCPGQLGASNHLTNHLVFVREVIIADGLPAIDQCGSL